MFSVLPLCYWLNDNSEIPRCEWEDDIKMDPKDRMTDRGQDLCGSAGIRGENWTEFWVA